MLRRRTLAILAAALALSSPIASEARAGVERLEVVGVVPAGEHAPPGVPPRQAALQAGVADALMQTAMRMLLQAGGEPEPAALAEALGDDPFSYAVRFRLLEDRGERRRLLIEDPEVEWEYVVLIEVHLDLDRVHDRLAQAGLLPPREPAGPLRSVQVAVEGLGSFHAYRAIRSALERDGDTLRPLEFAPGRGLFELETDRTPQELLDALLAHLPPEVRVSPIELGEGELRIRALEGSPAERSRALFGGADLGRGGRKNRAATGEDDTQPIDTPRPKRY